MTWEEFSELISNSEARQFARHNLLDDDCFVFNDQTIDANQTYASFRAAIADHLDINPRNVAIIGSAKFGWSMSPGKFGRAYIHGESDIDIVIVSRDFFESSWMQIRQAYYNGYEELRNAYRNDIFVRFVVVKGNMNYTSTYLRDLKVKLLDLNKIVNDLLSVEGKAKYRIYNDWSDVELYHTKGVRALQENLANDNT